jgi:F-type H+-transporting ATPase subunit b
VRTWISLGAIGLLFLGAAGGAFASEAAVSSSQLWDLVYRILNFVVLAGILVFFLRKPLKTGLKGRSRAIAQELNDLEKRRDEARRALAQMEGRLAEMDKERELILARFRQEGEQERKKILDDAHRLAERIKGQAQNTIELETRLAKADLRREVAQMSAALAEKLVREKITSEDQSRLFDEYLSKVRQEIS